MQTETTFYKNDDFNIIDDLHNGQIYLLTNKETGKNYVGQAKCFTGKNNNRWGTIGRWKSHIREAFTPNQDHCTLLNNAIRKYGPDNFEVKTLIKCNVNDLDENEIKFVQQYNCITPNGYNLKFGGYSSKNNESTIQKMKESHVGKEHSEKTKNKISKSQIGNRRMEKKRIYEEDNILPKYIVASRKNKIIQSYMIYNFPIGIEEKKYLKPIVFSKSKYGTLENALNEAKTHLEYLKEQYKYIEEETKILKEINIENSIFEKKENKILENLPEFIYPIIEENKLVGYYVDDILNKKGKKYPRRYFNTKTNRWNLDEAKKFVEMLKYINNNNVVLEFTDTDEMEVNDIEKSFYKQYYLPMYFNVYRLRGEILGFCINGFPCNKYKDGKYKKEFRMKTMKGTRTLDEAYMAGIEYLYELKKGIETL